MVRAQPELFGPVASDPTVSRLIDALAEQPDEVLERRGERNAEEVDKEVDKEVKRRASSPREMILATFDVLREGLEQ